MRKKEKTLPHLIPRRKKTECFCAQYCAFFLEIEQKKSRQSRPLCPTTRRTPTLWTRARMTMTTTQQRLLPKRNSFPPARLRPTSPLPPLLVTRQRCCRFWSAARLLRKFSLRLRPTKKSSKKRKQRRRRLCYCHCFRRQHPKKYKQ